MESSPGLSGSFPGASFHNVQFSSSAGESPRARFNGVIYDTTHGRGSFDDGYENEYRSTQGSCSLQSLDAYKTDPIIRSKSTDIRFQSDGFSHNNHKHSNNSYKGNYRGNRYANKTSDSNDSSSGNCGAGDLNPKSSQSSYHKKSKYPRRKYSNCHEHCSNDDEFRLYQRKDNSDAIELRMSVVPPSLVPPIAYDWTPSISC